MNNKSNWNYQEFKIYLLLYACYADFELKEEERQLILTNTSNEEYNHIHKVFKNDSDFEKIESIQSFRERFFSTQKDVDMLLKDISVILNIDDDFNLLEKNFFRMLCKILQNR
ncbi:MAG: hypothetical protein HXX18_00965 [Bacteroidetes bacterium]|nr:hypothetical protein [Bacteroidota bacterium]